MKTIGAASAVTAGGLVLAGPAIGQTPAPAAPPETNVADFMKVPKTARSLPGPFPGKVVKVTDKRSLVGETFDGKVIGEMVEKGISTLTGKNLKDSFTLLIDPRDVVGLKVNPVGPPLINTRAEVIDAVIKWLVDNGIKKSNIVIWDRFDYMLKDAGYTAERFPGVAIEGLQTMDEDEKGNKWKGPDGRHVSIDNFDKDVYFYAKGIVGKGVKGYPSDEFYLNQHVFNGEYSYFGKLVTKKLTRIINLAAYKNTGQSISMATKNLGYGALCNVGRLHAPLGLKTNVEVLAAPVLRDKLALNITDGLRGQYRRRPGQERPVRLRQPLALLRHRRLRARYDVPLRTGGQAQGDGRDGEREPAGDGIPALRRNARPRHGQHGQGPGREGLAMKRTVGSGAGRRGSQLTAASGQRGLRGIARNPASAACGRHRPRGPATPR